MIRPRIKDADQKRELIMAAAVEISRRDSYAVMTRDQVAAHAGVGAGTVNVIFGTMEGLREAVIKHAIANDITRIVADAVAHRHPAVKGLSPGMRQKCAAFLLS
jgi:AcrR family transcriptional regulator